MKTQRTRLTMLALTLTAFPQTGCQSIQLERHTIRQARTLTDLQYKLVLDNLAMIDWNPAALPFFSAAGTGLTNISQAAQASFSPSVDLLLNPAKTLYRYYSDKFGYGLQGTQTNLEQWTTASVLNPDELDLMRCVYRRTLGYADAKCESDLASYFASKPELMAAMQKGWLCVGIHGEKPPKNAAYVGHYDKHYVWVMPEAVEPLTRVTLAILDIATAVQPSATSSRVNPNADRIKVLQDQATVLGTILDKYPNKDTSPSPLAKQVRDQIDLLLTQILLLEGRQRDEIIGALTGKEKPLIPMGAGEVPPRQLTPTDAAELVDEALKVLPVTAPAFEAPAQPAWRPRKNLYNPTVIPIGSNFP